MHPASGGGLRCALQDRRPWATCGGGGGDLQGQTHRRNIQAQGDCRGTICSTDYSINNISSSMKVL